MVEQMDELFQDLFQFDGPGQFFVLMILVIVAVVCIFFPQILLTREDFSDIPRWGRGIIASLVAGLFFILCYGFGFDAQFGAYLLTRYLFLAFGFFVLTFLIAFVLDDGKKKDDFDKKIRDAMK